ncbi:MAG TPA: SMP-30/gluconolactonase/LRE family protein [Devosiaceae bacterium]
MRAELLIDCKCQLGEGPLWHTGRQELFWFDILGKRLYSATADGHMQGEWAFDRHASAAAIVSDTELAIAQAGKVIRLDLASDARTDLAPLEADMPGNRSNDGRVHPSGAFWIGTMSLTDTPGMGSVYAMRAGRMERVVRDISISNSICFSPDGRTAYFADTPTGLIVKCAIDPDTGLPVSSWELFADTRNEPGKPDGSVVDSEGCLWSARWGGFSVIRYTPQGSIDRVIEVPSRNVTCPSFGGADLRTLFLTTARSGLNTEQLNSDPHAGGIYVMEPGVAGQAEPNFIP